VGLITAPLFSTNSTHTWRRAALAGSLKTNVTDEYCYANMHRWKWKYLCSDTPTSPMSPHRTQRRTILNNLESVIVNTCLKGMVYIFQDMGGTASVVMTCYWKYVNIIAMSLWRSELVVRKVLKGRKRNTILELKAVWCNALMKIRTYGRACADRGPSDSTGYGRYIKRPIERYIK